MDTQKTRKTRRKVAPGLWQLNTMEDGRALWQLRKRVVNKATGKLVAKWTRFEGTKIEALARLELLASELRSPTLAAAPPETLLAYATSWLKTRLARGDLAETTQTRYATALDLHILPSLGALLVTATALTPRVIEQALVEWGSQHERTSANGWLRVLRTVLSSAVRDGLLLSNPAASVEALTEDEDELADDDGADDDISNALTPAELDRYLRAWMELYPQHFALIATLVLTGARWSEVTALQWTDVDAAATRGTIRIRRRVVRRVVRNTTKTRRKRAVPWPEALSAILSDHRRTMVAAQHPGLKQGWVFANLEGHPMYNGCLSKPSRKVLKHAGIRKRVTIHGLRRTANDLLRLAEVDKVARKAIIGHTTDRMSEHYSSVSADEARGIGSRLVNLVPAVASSAPSGRSSGRS